MRILTQNKLNETFGKDVVLLNYDSKSSLVLSKYEDITKSLGNEEKWMIHKVCTQDDCRITLEDGSYLGSFEEAAIVWLKRTNKRFQVNLNISIEDAHEVNSAIYRPTESPIVDCTLETKEGLFIEIELTVGDEEDSDEE